MPALGVRESEFQGQPWLGNVFKASSTWKPASKNNYLIKHSYDIEGQKMSRLLEPFRNSLLLCILTLANWISFSNQHASPCWPQTHCVFESAFLHPLCLWNRNSLLKVCSFNCFLRVQNTRPCAEIWRRGEFHLRHRKQPTYSSHWLPIPAPPFLQSPLTPRPLTCRPWALSYGLWTAHGSPQWRRRSRCPDSGGD